MESKTGIFKIITDTKTGLDSPIVLSDEKILENDLCIDIRNNLIWRNVHGVTGSVLGGDEFLSQHFKKVIVPYELFSAELKNRIYKSKGLIDGDPVIIEIKDNGKLHFIKKNHNSNFKYPTIDKTNIDTEYGWDAGPGPYENKTILIKGCNDCPFCTIIGKHNDIILCTATENNDGDCKVIRIEKNENGKPDWCPLIESEIILKLK